MKLKFFKFEDEIDFETNFMEEKYISTINLYFMVYLINVLRMKLKVFKFEDEN